MILPMKPEVIITDTELPTEVIWAIAEGRKIEAIKMLRESTGIGLANAKVLIDRAWREHGPKKPLTPALTEDAGSGKLVVSLVAVAIVAVAYLLYPGN